MYPINPLSRFTSRGLHRTPTEFGLAVNGAGVAAGTFTKEAIGNTEGGPVMIMCVVIGNIPTAATGGTEGTGISPLPPKGGIIYKINAERQSPGDGRFAFKAPPPAGGGLWGLTYAPVLQSQANP
jgi:hypothetical protein